MPFDTHSLAVVNAWWEAAERMNEWTHEGFRLLPNLVLGAVVFVLILLAGRLARSLIQRFADEKHKHHNYALVMGRLVQGVVFVLAILVAATIVFPGFTPASLLSFLGIGSVAIGFAFRDVLQNYLAGILLLLTEPFRIGDQVIFDKFEGTVEDIQTRATLIRTYDNRRVVVPNAQLFTNSIMVNTAHEKRRMEYDLGIGYGDDIDEAKRVLLEVLRQAPGAIDHPPPEVLAYELGEYSVTLRLRWWINPPTRKELLDARDQVLVAAKKALSENGIDMPFPVRTVLLHDQTESTDGDRRRQREGWPAGRGEVPSPRPIGAMREHEGPDGKREE